MNSIFVPAFSLLVGLYGADIDVREHRLDNGLKVLFVENHSAPVVAVQVWYRVGSKNETAGMRGISHLLEHMMFKGSAHVGPEEHMRQIGRVGGRTNAFTSEDVTVYHEVVPSSAAELAFRLEADRMASLTLSSDALRTEHEVVKEELRARDENSPWARFYNGLLKVLYKVHPYQYSVIGTLEDLDSAKAATLRDYYRKYYAPDNAVMIVVGDMTWANVEALARKYFAPIGFKRGEIAPIQQEPQSQKEQKVTFKLPMQLAQSGVAYRIPAANHPDIPAIEVIIDVLVRGRSSRLHKRLVRQDQTAVGVYDVTETYQDPGFFFVSATHSEVAQTKRIQKTMLQEIEQIARGGVTAEELTRAKNHLLANFTFGLYSFSGQAFGLGNAEVYYGDYRSYFERSRRYDRLTSEEIKAAAAKYLSRNNRVRFQIAPVKPAEGQNKRSHESR